jgi:hypothetical protein
MSKHTRTFEKTFSMAHPEDGLKDYPNNFYLMIKNTPQETLSELRDIYFGKFFHYKDDKGNSKKYGNIMGCEATDAQVENLFKIQTEFGVEISLTVNQLNIPQELLMNQRVHDEFVEWVGQFYDKGLRSCTIGSVHTMRMGDLQTRCPDMLWKNTVNHQLVDAQMVADYVTLGYGTILLDRSLNRDIVELKKIKKLITKYNKTRAVDNQLTTSLLVREACVYSCPFKREHDDISATISSEYFGTLDALSCRNWRNPENYTSNRSGAKYEENMPRVGIDLIAINNDAVDTFLNVVDILKFSGRLSNGLWMTEYTEEEIVKYGINFIWAFIPKPTRAPKNLTLPKMWYTDYKIFSNTFQNIYDCNLDNVLPHWNIMPTTTKEEQRAYMTNKSDFDSYVDKNFIPGSFPWTTPAGKDLAKTLMSCKTQCYDCHKCESVFGMKHIDSLLTL